MPNCTFVGIKSIIHFKKYQMYRNNLFLVLLLSLLIGACASETSTEGTTATEETTSANMEKFGEAITADGAVAYGDMLAKMGDTDSLAIKVKGKVESVCKVKGCWMNVVSDDPNQEAMFVQFKDYGFFMPLDCEGKTVVMDGYAYRDVTSVEDLKHFAEDEGKSQEEIDAITEPVEELKFLAHGVVMTD